MEGKIIEMKCMKIPNINDLKTSKLNDKFFSKYYPEFYSFLNDNYKDCKSLSEKLYLYYNGLTERPKCVVCGSEVGFEGVIKGFRKHCCRKCSNNNPETLNKIKRTNLEKYGVENVSKNNHIREKAKKTCLRKYGAEHASQNASVKEKVKLTNLKKYGVEYAMRNELIKERVTTSLRKISTNNHPDLIRYDENNNWICKCPHSECNKCTEKEYVIGRQNYNNRKNYGAELCTKLLPIQASTSTPELQIAEFLRSLNIDFEISNRTIIAPKELDIYIPSKKIAIEFNGSYWHSVGQKDKYYHHNKTLECYSKGIQLIHIYESEWNTDSESIKNKLKSLLEGNRVDGWISVKESINCTLSEPILIDCDDFKVWNEGKWVKINEITI